MTTDQYVKDMMIPGLQSFIGFSPNNGVYTELFQSAIFVSTSSLDEVEKLIVEIEKKKGAAVVDMSNKDLFPLYNGSYGFVLRFLSNVFYDYDIVEKSGLVYGFYKPLPSFASTFRFVNISNKNETATITAKGKTYAFEYPIFPDWNASLVDTNVNEKLARVVEYQPGENISTDFERAPALIISLSLEIGKDDRKIKFTLQNNYGAKYREWNTKPQYLFLNEMVSVEVPDYKEFGLDGEHIYKTLAESFREVK